MMHNVPGNGCDCRQCVATERAYDPTSYVNQPDFVCFMARSPGPEQWAWSFALFIRAGYDVEWVARNPEAKP